MSMLLAVSLACSLVSNDDAPPGPPGLVLVQGGKTKIGSAKAHVEELALAQEALAVTFAAELPQFTRDVDDFFLMPTEVTNEQYAEFVKATGARPPRSWGIKALQDGQAAFLLEQGQAKQAARAAGQPFEQKVFEPEAWWAENWKSVAWEVPSGAATHPVVFVTFADAQGYARWSGLRLMSEFEFQRAARRDTARIYPWGDQWDDKQFCHSLLTGKDQSAPAGTYPAGAAEGIFDLAGNVWEWTSSPFEPYPGYEPLLINKGKRKIQGIAPFDPNQRVAVSGSFHMDKVGVRISTRMNTDRVQATNALGFRCAASLKPGLDAAQALIEQELRLSVIGDAELAPQSASVLRKWDTGPGTSSVPGYALITGYQHVLFCPRLELPATTTDNLTDLSVKDGPVFIGFLDLPRPMAKPELDAGTYWVAWRGAGDLPKPPADKQGVLLQGQADATTPFHEVQGFDATKNCFLFYSALGEPQLALEATAPKVEKIRAGTLTVEPFVPPDPKTLPKDAPPPTPLDTVRITVALPSTTSKSKAFLFDLPILVAPGTYDASWK